MQTNRIQCTIRHDDMYRFEPLLQEGHCYVISDFSVGENNGKLPLLPHKYKIVFFRSTVVTKIDQINDDLYGFKLEPFNEILTKKYHEMDSVGKFFPLSHHLFYSYFSNSFFKKLI